MKNNPKLLITLLVIFILLFITFNINPFLGIVFVLLFVLYKLYTSRSFIYALIGNGHFSKGNKEQALYWFNRASNLKSSSPRVITSYAYLLLKEREVLKAKEILETLIQRKELTLQETSQLKMTLALVYWKEGNINNAVKTLEEVFQVFKNSTLYESLGYLLIVQGDLEKALSFNREALEYNDSSSIIKDNLAQTYFHRGELHKAEEIYSKLIPENPTFAEPYYYYALILKGNGQTDKALEMLRTSASFKESFLTDLPKEEIQNQIDILEKSKAVV